MLMVAGGLPLSFFFAAAAASTSCSPRGWNYHQPREHGRRPVVAATVAAEVTVIGDGGVQDEANDVVARVGGGVVAVMAVAAKPIVTATVTATLSPPQRSRDRGRAWGGTAARTRARMRRAMQLGGQ